MLVATVTGADAAADVTNTAEITAADQYDPTSTPGNGVPGEDDQASVVVSPQRIDLTLTKSVDNENALLNDTAVFTVTLTNTGDDLATGVVVTDAVPLGLSDVVVTPFSK